MNTNRFLKNSNFNSELTYFKETVINGYVTLPQNVENIKKALNLFSKISINSVEISCGESLTSNEGQILTGFKLVINYSIKENLKYIGFDNSVFFFSSPEILGYCNIIVPQIIDDTNTEQIIYTKNYNINTYLENVEFYCVDDHTFYYHNTVIFNFHPFTS